MVYPTISLRGSRKPICFQRSRDSYKHTEEWNEKIKQSNIKTFSERPDLKEKSRQNMLKYCAPYSHNIKSNEKRIASRRLGRGWKCHSDISKKKMKIATENRWMIGKYDNRKPTLKSKGQKELISELNSHGDISIVEEYRIGTKPFDVFVEEKKLLVEFNGTYWHLDPRFYNGNYYDKTRKCYASDIWKYDKEKINEAKKMGFNVYVVWQYDWENGDRNEIIERILYGRN